MDGRILNRVLSTLCIFLFICGVCLAQEGQKEPLSAQTAAISMLSGKVEVWLKDAVTWEETIAGTLLNEGEQIRTAAGAKAELRLPDDSFIRLKENTTLGITTARKEVSTEAVQYNLDFRVGEIMAELKKLNPGSTFEVHTPTAVVAARGTTFYLHTGSKLLAGIAQAFTDLYVDSDDILSFTNLISGETHYVHQSQASSSYGDGTTEAPATVPPATQDEWKSGWEIEEGAEGGESEEGALEEEEEEEKEDKTQDESKAMTNEQFAAMLVGVLGLEMPADADKLSDSEFFEVLANMLAERGITLFRDANPSMQVTRGNAASVLYDALRGPNNATIAEKIAYLAGLGYLRMGAANNVISSRELTDALNIPALSKAVAEAYSPPETGETGPGAPPAAPPPPPAAPEQESPPSPIS